VPARKMHADEVDIDAPLVRRLIAAQFPRWAALPIEPIDSAGTDNAIYRLGRDMAARLPRVGSAARQLDKEHEWLPRLAPRLPFATPVPRARGGPGEGYPWSWSVSAWLEGEDAMVARVGDPRQAATDLARVVAALQRIDTAGGPPPGAHNFGRGVPLAQRDDPTREAIRALGGVIDGAAVTAAWDAALRAPAWRGPPVWIHGDLSAGNLLFVEGRLSAVIDFGGLGVGDPACDLMIAWTLFSG
jgi:aminoglycoside phosphotransferase (APT) family kinase protein